MSWLSDEALAKIESVRQQGAFDQQALLTALRLTQEELHRVGPDEVAQIAGLLDLSLSTVEGVARFYDQITARRTGQRLLRLCRGISCQLLGADQLAAELTGRLDLDEDGTTPDGSLTVQRVECVGNCDQAPTGLIGDRFIGPLQAADLAELILAAEGDGHD